MKTLKRIASLLMVAALILQVSVIAATVPQDVIGTEFETAAKLLSALDIMVGDGKEFKPNDNITRAEFAQVLAKTMHLDDLLDSYEPVGTFEDVPTNDQFAPAIEIGAQIGAVSGYGDGNFGPEDNITGEQAIKLLLCALGYNINADLAGGFPAGYNLTAADVGMLKGVVTAGTDMTQPISRGKAAILCYNALKIEVMQKVSYGAEVTYATKPGETLLSMKHNVYQFEGTVITNGNTDLIGSSNIRQDAVVIEGETTSAFLIGATNIAEQLGTYVKVYYRLDPDSNDRTIVSYDVVSNKNGVVNVALSDIIAGTYENLKGTGANKYRLVSYWEDKENDNTPKDIKVAYMPSIIYNGTSVQTFVFDDILDMQGSISMIDNNSDGIVDILNITAYENYVVASTDAKEYSIVDKFGFYDKQTASTTPRVLDLDIGESGNIVTITDKNGKAVQFATLREWTVLSVAQSDQSLSRRISKVLVSTETVEGIITEIGSEDGRPTVKVDDTVYQITPEYINSLEKDEAIPNASFNVGDNRTFYLNAFGKIAASKINVAGDNLAYGLLTKWNKTQGVDIVVKVRIFTENELKNYTLSLSKVTIDGVVYKNAEDMYAAIGRNLSMDKVSIYQSGGQAAPVLFKTNEAGEITFIDTPYYNIDAGETAYSLKPINEGFKRCTYKGLVFGTSYPVSTTTKFIEVPRTYEGVSEAINMKTRGVSSFTSGVNDDVQYDVKLYTVDADGFKGDYGLVYGSGGGGTGSIDTSANTNFLIVKKVTKAVSAYSGEETIKIYGYQNGNEVEMVVSANYYSHNMFTDVYDNTIKSVRGSGTVIPTPSEDRKKFVVLPGDILKYATDSHKEISVVQPVYLSDVKDFVADIMGNPGGITYKIMAPAVVARIQGNSVFLNRYAVPKGNLGDDQSSDAFGNQYICNLSQFKILIYDPSKTGADRVLPGSISDIKDKSSGTPSRVFFQLRANDPRVLYVIKDQTL